MKHEWLMNSKLWTLAWMVLFAVLLLASGVLTLGQEPHHDGAPFSPRDRHVGG